MITAFLLLIAIALTVWGVTGILDGHKRPPRPIWSLHYMTSLTALIGCGFYGLLLFDTNLITPFSWAAMIIIAGGSWIFLWAIRRSREADIELIEFIEQMRAEGIGVVIKQEEKEEDKG